MIFGSGQNLINHVRNNYYSCPAASSYEPPCPTNRGDSYSCAQETLRERNTCFCREKYSLDRKTEKASIPVYSYYLRATYRASPTRKIVPPTSDDGACDGALILLPECLVSSSEVEMGELQSSERYQSQYRADATSGRATRLYHRP